MENFAPGLRDSVLTLTEAFRFVLFFVCVAGFMLQVHQARAEQDSLLAPVLRAIVVIGLITTLPHWFELAEKVFLALADLVQEGYREHPMRAAVLVRDTVTDGGSDFSFQRFGESFYRATLYALAKLIVLVGSLLQLPFLVLQFILKLLCYLFLPLALACYMVPSLASLATRYVQQTLAVLAWPVGFAVTELVAYHLLTAYATNLAAAYGIAPGEIDTASFASLLGGLLAALWLILGTLGTPVLMQMLFCSGSPMSAGQGLQQLYTLQQIVWIAKSLKTSGAAAALVAPKGMGQAPKEGGLPPPLPPATPPLPPPSPAPVSPTDPAGDRATAALVASVQPPAPQPAL
jgi:hypothetical protein